MENTYRYFNRDVSWLSFNYRVLMEAEDRSLPIYERVKFLSIYSSNMEEFYEIRVAEHRGVILKKNYAEESSAEAEAILSDITREVNRQQQEYQRIYRQVMADLAELHIHLYQDSRPLPFHEAFVRDFFNEEVFPFLEPMLIQKDDIRTFIRDKRLYLVIRMTKRSEAQAEHPQFYYALMKIPFSKVPRFIELPRHEGEYYLMFIDDIIRANLPSVFPGYTIDSCYNIKISRDADIYLDDETSSSIVENIRKKLKKRKIGALSRFMYDMAMPQDFLDFLCDAFSIGKEDLVMGGRYNNLQDLAKLPNPYGKELEQQPLPPIRIPYLDSVGSMLRAVKKGDIFLHFPYESFDYLIRLLMEAAVDPTVQEIKITQYRVAENSAVINTIPGLKVHAKVAVILRKDTASGKKRKDIAYLSTGNFNEKTARIYSDMALLTCKPEIIGDINKVFDVLEEKITAPQFTHLLVARFNMVPELERMIEREIAHVRQGRKGRIILKMNGLHDTHMIDCLYHASECGVEIDLIVRGICCLVPNQPYSRNIRITRIVDRFLEHSRVWYFYNDGAEDLYLTSADWMRRNLNRRIETAFPILEPSIKQKIIDILQIQLKDNVKACWIDEHLNNIFKRKEGEEPVRSQMEIYRYLKSVVRSW